MTRYQINRSLQPTRWARSRLAAVAVILALFAAAPTAEAQQATRVVRIGLLWPGASEPPGPRMPSFHQGLRDSGYVAGQNAMVVVRHPSPGRDQMQELAAELVKLDVAVIAAFGDLAARAETSQA
jgi:hypothetical protein